MFSSNHLYLILACSSVSYYFVERMLRSIFRHFRPHIYNKLLIHGKTGPFFGIAIGFLITLFSTPSCVQAYQQLPTRAHLDFGNPGPAEICVGARTLLWMEELPRLGSETHYLLHHIASLFVVASTLFFNLPGAKLLCGIIASLVCELGTDTSAMLAYCGFTASQSRWVWRLECLNLATTLVVRLPAVYVLCNSPWYHGLPVVQQVCWMLPTFLYVAYQTHLTHARIRRLRDAKKALRL